MDWMLFWTAFGAIGTTVGSLITAIAVVVAVVQYKQPLRKQIKITTGWAYIPFFAVEDMSLECFFSISIGNTGVRNVTITNVYLETKTKRLLVQNLMVDMSNWRSRVSFPKELPPEGIIPILIPCTQLKKALFDLLGQKELTLQDKLRVLTTDTTEGEYRSEWLFTVDNFIHSHQ